ncbi:MAG: DUF3617 family protein [Caulobacteraceae bacterium]|nr:DUF3617 family protein [Caulobacteraceae bacterium]
MRVPFTKAGVALAGLALAGLALAGLAGCNKPSPAPSSAPSAAAPSAAAPAAAGGPIALENLPHRKPGLWRQTIEMEGAAHSPPATELCLDAAAEAKLSAFGQQAAEGKCQSQQFTRNLDGTISFSSSCDLGQGHIVSSKGLVTGDFNAGYKIAMDTTTTGAPMEQMNGEHRMTVTATWAGPCPTDMKPGDMTMAGGMKMNVLNHPMAGQ